MTRIRGRASDSAESFEAVYQQTVRQVYASVRRRAGAETAEQVVSDTFLAAWRLWQQVPDPPLPWLLRTAHNALLTHRRSERRQGRLTAAVLFDTTLVTMPSAEAEALDRQRTLDALHLLSDDDREALLLVAWDGLNYTQAAQVQGISRSAFATRLSRARRRLHTHLGDDDPQPTPHLKGVTA